MSPTATAATVVAIYMIALALGWGAAAFLWFRLRSAETERNSWRQTATYWHGRVIELQLPKPPIDGVTVVPLKGSVK